MKQTNARSPLYRQQVVLSTGQFQKHQHKNPAAAYILSLQSKLSREKISYFLHRVAKIITGMPNVFECPWHALRRHHVQKVLNILQEEGLAPATMNIYLTAFKGVAYEAWTMTLIDQQAYEAIKKIKAMKGQRIVKGRALETDEVRAMFEVLAQDKSVKSIRDQAILAVLLGCGLRRSELVALDLSHVRWRDNALIIMGKGNKQRVAFMPDSASKRLKVWLQEVRGDSAGSLFTRIRRHGDVQMSRITSQAIYDLLRKIAALANIEQFSPHDLRRTFATQLMDHGIDMMTVRDMMGHAQITTTQTYIRIKDENMKKASQILAF